uniref:Low density lipoprotein receptor adaptor protein 1a n=1 Tax=Fundulus heteroclitus TaxID=8078 RepID=A0A3Q2PUX0_FUNHE
MDALRSAGRAIVRSPSMAKQSWSAGRHRSKADSWRSSRGEKRRRVVGSDRSASGKKPQKVSLKVSPQGIIMLDRSTNKLLERVSIYRISYCTVDNVHDKVFAYIAQNNLNGTLECHAYLCSKRKVVSSAKGVERVKSGSAGDASSSSRSERHYRSFLSLSLPCFLRGLRLAASRTNPQVLDIGVTPRDWLAEPDWNSADGNTRHCFGSYKDDIYFGFKKLY